jgi:catechol 2,3-dioxygenase-like lactoylglutathione lyase family enzyme
VLIKNYTKTFLVLVPGAIIEKRRTNMANEGGISSDWKIMQIGLVVRDMKKAAEQLTALGLGPFIPKYLPPGSQGVFRGKTLDARVDVQRSMIGNVELELCQPVSGKSAHQEFLDSKGEGIQHILFEVQDIEAELQRFTSLGATILLQVEFKGGGLAYVDLNTCGFVVELIQLPKDDPDTLKILLSR